MLTVSCRLNGVGGKAGANETIEATAVREAQEETGLQIAEGALRKHGVIEFRFVDSPRHDSLCHLFSCPYQPEEQG